MNTIYCRQKKLLGQVFCPLPYNTVSIVFYLFILSLAFSLRLKEEEIIQLKSMQSEQYTYTSQCKNLE